MQLLSSVKSSITCLFRLSMATRDPAPDDRLQSIITVDKSHFEKDHINHVIAKFPNCPDHLAARLGQAISARRQYLSYCEQHHKKLSDRQDFIVLEPPRTEYTGSSTGTTSSEGAPRVALGEHSSVSETSYAVSVDAIIRGPPFEKGQSYQNCECPLCYKTVLVRTRAAWK